MPAIVWSCVSFTDLTPNELYAIIRLRNEVFVVEQNCVYQDADNKDQKSIHLMGWVDGHLAAYARLLPNGVSYPFISIGRVITSPEQRRTGAGKQLINTAIKYCDNLFGKQPIKIGAQLYLKNFYESFGFVQQGNIYDEDGIDHIEMMRP